MASAFSTRAPSDLARAAMFAGPASQQGRRNDSVCENRSASCADCSTQTVCAYVGGGYQFLYTNKCPEDRPFCVDGACQPTADECDLPALATDFTCVDGDDVTGYYPSPYSCDKNYVCANNSTAYVYNCPEDHVYSHARAGCVREDMANCDLFPKCSSYPDYVLYPSDASVYAVCTPGRTLVSKCPASYRIDPSHPDEPCRPFCSQQGRFAHADDPRGYYDCDLVPLGGQAANCTSCAAPGVLTDPVRQTCPPGMVYSRLDQRCVLQPSSP